MANPILVVDTTSGNSTGFTSILGDKSALYRTKTQEGGGILDNPEEGTLEFYCAGYTKSDPKGFNRQDWHKKLYAAAVKRGTENKLYPLSVEEYQITIVHDPTNTFDPNRAALRILFRPISEKLKKVFTGAPEVVELGFVPARINMNVLKNMDMVNSVQILKTRVGFHEKYCTTKVVLAYGHNRSGSKKLPSASRFMGILDEV